MKATFPILIAALFLGGCASTKTDDVKTWYKIACKADDHGVWRHQNSRVPITGRVVEYKEGELRFEFFVKDGVKNGRFREWHVAGEDSAGQGGTVKKGHPYIDAVYENGELVRLKKFWPSTMSPHWGSPKRNGVQLVIMGWNQDGTPSEPGEEKNRLGTPLKE